VKSRKYKTRVEMTDSEKQSSLLWSEWNSFLIYPTYDDDDDVWLEFLSFHSTLIIKTNKERGKIENLRFRLHVRPNKSDFEVQCVFRFVLLSETIAWIYALHLNVGLTVIIQASNVFYMLQSLASLHRDA